MRATPTAVVMVMVTAAIMMTTATGCGSRRPPDEAPTSAPGDRAADRPAPGSPPVAPAVVGAAVAMIPHGAAATTAPAGEQAEPGDYQKYVAELKRTVPIVIKDFATKTPAHVRVEDYQADTRYDGLVTAVELKLTPVWLKDSVTGKTVRYTRAFLVRNNPAPSRYPEPFAWVGVKLLP
ncbi:MAG: hypothetical protein EBV68_00475 [Betaproteobacteria bacterium]|nr:hypothetical protein [Betaproteobacteria bacterium]